MKRFRKKTRKKPVPRLRYPLTRSIALVGLMGAGKTTVGMRLARRLGIPFMDSDAEIEVAAGHSVSEIFEKYGEQDFRDGERKVINRLITGPHIVLGTGGGAFMDADTRRTLKDKAITVWLRADVELLVERTSRRDTRPLLKQGDPRQILRDLAAKRYPVYAEADICVESGAGAHEEVVNNIIRKLNHYLAEERIKNKGTRNEQPASR
ncbi:shikimate kinase [Emcibacter nanhaiensis]|uniref:Shikimate kinase n=1 Tax=Emcibacter nanhaiensis TaxID=1505037 RepID=A0A501PNQ9_9PROT|nr:shikimate kinase [Emcibacter nanhaiensis]TPD61406.1 shikimate kinase [Emcibacter nanhaiensis]